MQNRKMERSYVEVLIVSGKNCNDPLVEEVKGIQKYLSRYLQDRVHIKSRCICGSPLTAAEQGPVVYVGDKKLHNPTLSQVIDAVYLTDIRIREGFIRETLKSA